MSGYASIPREDILRVVPRGDPVVHLLRCPCNPFRLVGGKGHPADGRIVPQEAVTQGGNHEGHGNLAVALGQFQHRTLQVQVRLLILPHPVDLLAFIGVKTHGQLIFPGADDALPFPVDDFQAAAGLCKRAAVETEILAQDQASVPVEADNPGKVYRRADPAVHNLRAGRLRNRAIADPIVFLSNRDSAFCRFRGFRQRPVMGGSIFIHISTNPEGIRPPGFDPQRLAVMPGDQRIVFL